MKKLTLIALTLVTLAAGAPAQQTQPSPTAAAFNILAGTMLLGSLAIAPGWQLHAEVRNGGGLTVTRHF